MKFSICIPNFNYEKYLGRTIKSALDQNGEDLEILVSDNASTDSSIDVVRQFGDPRIRISKNACNVGFAGNLDRAARMAQGDRIIMLSSDDLMKPDALTVYSAFCRSLGTSADKAVVTATWDVIDPDDAITGREGPDGGIWTEADRRPDLEAVVGAPVYGVGGGELLRRSLLRMRNPFNFAATCYPRRLYEQVEGYGGGRMFNPDKWFHWKLLSVAEQAYFIDRPLFCYRWHPNNQSAQEANAGALKFLVDEYVSTLEIDVQVLQRIGLSRDDVVAAFIEHDIARHALATLARGQRGRARRILGFGRAVYPNHTRRNRKIRLLKSLLLLGPIGQQIAKRAYGSYLRKIQVAKHEAVLK